MAEEQGGEKTEQPTPRRQNEARRDGMVGQSTELSQVLGIIAAFIAIQHVSPYLWNSLLIILRSALTSRYFTEPLTAQALHEQFIALLFLLVPQLLLILVIAAFFGAGTTAIQTKFLWSPKLFRPKFSQLNPVQGMKRIFSLNNAVNLLKSLAKLAIIAPIAYTSFFDLFPQLLALIDVPVTELLPITADMASTVFWKIIPLLFIVAVVDVIWQKTRTKKRLMMSKQEVKDERKATEGDETMRRRILAIGFQRLRQKMLQAVKTADVVVTNPTHYAVALKYDPELGGAPRVVAKGKNHLAARIREIAKANGVPVVERKPLARALYSAVEVGQEIPYELFKAVAELLAYVYRIKGRRPLSRSASTPRQSQR